MTKKSAYFLRHLSATMGCKGFSIIEMVLATLLVISLSAVSYRVLKSLTSTQNTAVSNQKLNSSASLALDRFKRDVTMIDYNWTRYGVAAIYPHPGYEFGANFYNDAVVSTVEKLDDGVTFLRRDPATDRIYEFAATVNYCYPTAVYANDKDLYANGLVLNTSDGLSVNDWVVIYQAGKYALGVVTEVPGPFAVKIRAPNANEEQAYSLDNTSQSTGYIEKPGVWTANMDVHANITPKTTDDAFCFESQNTRLQKISSPVSYFVDYQTSDGQPKSMSNSYTLDKSGNKKRMLVRQEYNAGGVQREYLTNVDQVGFTYDELTDDTTVAGGINKDIGRTTDLNNHTIINLSNADPTQSDISFHSTNKLVAIKMDLSLASDGVQEHQAGWKQSQELKIALDPELNQGMYQENLTIASSLTNPLNTIPKSLLNSAYEQIGKPLYHPTSIDGATAEMLVPTSTFLLTGHGGVSMQSEGQVFVYDQDGKIFNADRDGSPSAYQSSIIFDTGAASRFFPNTVAEIPNADGSTRILVGGMTMSGTDATSLTRTPVLGIVDLAAGETVQDKLNAASANMGQCNISNCGFQKIDNGDLNTKTLFDTANITVDNHSGDIYLTSMTKDNSPDSLSSVYKGTWNGSNYDFSKWGDVEDTDKGRVVSAVSDKMISIAGDKWMAVCLTKKIDATCGPDGCINTSNDGLNGDFNAAAQVMGKIQLMRFDTATQTTKTIPLKYQNYRCSSMNVDQDNNILVSGRLSIQGIAYSDIQRALTDSTFHAAMVKTPMYLDEIAIIKNGDPYYADYFRVDPTSYAGNQDPDYGQKIGWLNGTSMTQYPDGSFGLLDTNKFRLDANFQINNSGQVREYSDAGIGKLNLAGMTDRVVATIETNYTNINNSMVTTTFTPKLSSMPNLYIPGTFYLGVNANGPRIAPTPLPAIAPSMDDGSWLTMYSHMLSPMGQQSLNGDMPIYGNGSAPYIAHGGCQLSLPNTCR